MPNWIPRSLRAGGCTFPEDPELDCIRAAPLWSADVDPCVLSANADPASSDSAVDLAAFARRVMHGGDVEHVHLVMSDTVFRLDVRRGSICADPCALTFLLAHNARLPRQLETLRRLDALLAGRTMPSEAGMTRFSRLATALRAWDLRVGGASLRQVADELWGPGDWPGPGEHRKSAVRRHVERGERLVAGGPRPILASF